MFKFRGLIQLFLFAQFVMALSVSCVESEKDDRELSEVKTEETDNGKEITFKNANGTFKNKKYPKPSRPEATPGNKTPPSLPSDSNIAEQSSTVDVQQISLSGTVDLRFTSAVIIGMKMYFIGIKQDLYILDLITQKWSQYEILSATIPFAASPLGHDNYLSVQLHDRKSSNPTGVETFAIYNISNSQWETSAIQGAPKLDSTSGYVFSICSARKDFIVCPPSQRAGSFDPKVYTYDIVKKLWSSAGVKGQTYDTSKAWNRFDGESFYNIGTYGKIQRLSMTSLLVSVQTYDLAFPIDIFGLGFGYGIWSKEAPFYSTGETWIGWLENPNLAYQSAVIKKVNAQGQELWLDDFNGTSVSCKDKLWHFGSYGFVSQEIDLTRQPTSSFSFSFDPKTNTYSTPTVVGSGPRWFGPHVLCGPNDTVYTWAGVEKYSCTGSPGGQNCSGIATNSLYRWNLK